MSRAIVLGLSMLLLLAAFPLVSIGTMRDNEALWWTGLAALFVGGLIPPLRRLLLKGREAIRATRAGLEDDERVS